MFKQKISLELVGEDLNNILLFSSAIRRCISETSTNGVHVFLKTEIADSELNTTGLEFSIKIRPEDK